MSDIKVALLWPEGPTPREQARARAFILAAYPDEADVFLDALGLDGAP